VPHHFTLAVGVVFVKLIFVSGLKGGPHEKTHPYQVDPHQVRGLLCWSAGRGAPVSCQYLRYLALSDGTQADRLHARIQP
jgi:hypothetical protein